MPAAHSHVMTADDGVVYGVKVAWWSDSHTLWREDLDSQSEDLYFRVYSPHGSSGSILADGTQGFWPTTSLLPYLQWLSDHMGSLGVDQSRSTLKRVQRRDPIAPAGFTVEGDELEAMLLLGTPYYLLPNHLLQEWAAERWLR